MNDFFEKLSSPREISKSILFIIGIISLIIVSKQILKNRTAFHNKIIALYISLILLQLLIGFYNFFQVEKLHGKHNSANISGYLFIVFEYVILTYLIGFKLKSKLIKKALSISSLFFIPIAIFNWFYFNPFSEGLSITTTLEAIPLILACLYFFYELLQNPPILRLNKEPSFWIATGILFLFICILPFYLAFEYFEQIPEMQIVDFIGYAIIMILFAKASLCKGKQVV